MSGDASSVPTACQWCVPQAYLQGTEYFNQKPAKGITFLQEQGLLSSPLDAGQVVTFLKENPKLDKKMIGEYIGSKKNQVVLEAFVKSVGLACCCSLPEHCVLSSQWVLLAAVA